MPPEEDLRRSWAPLFVFLVAPVFTFVVRWRWRLATARQEEVRRLAFLAAQESIREEAEAMKAYVSTSAAALCVEKDTSVRPPECLVCFNPAMARCGQCKAVRYCSGKCQIIHWRRGHKDECRSPIINGSKCGLMKVNDSERTQSEEPDLLEKSLAPNEGLSATAVENPRRSSALKSASPNAFREANKPEELDPKLGETSSSDILTTNPKTGPDAYNANPSASLIPELARSNPSLMEKPSTFETEVNHSMAISQSSLKVTNSLYALLSKTESQTEEETSNSGNRIPISAARAIAAEIYLMESKTSGTFAFASDLLSTAGNAMNVASPSSPKVSPGEPVRSSNSFAAIGNAVSVSTKSSEPAASILLEVKSQTQHNEVPASNIETSDPPTNGAAIKEQSLKSNTLRSLASSSKELLDNSGGQTTTSCESLARGSAVRRLIRSDDASGATSNGLPTAAKIVLKQPMPYKTTRNYPSELMLFPYHLFIKLYNPGKIQLHPCGLTNNGNSCYANVVLQCLAFTRPLSTYLLNGLHSMKCPKKEWCFTCELERLVMHTKQSESPLSPLGVLSHLHKIGSNFTHGQQQDAHEFLRYAVDVMQSECLKQARAKPEGMLAEETTLVQQTFGGYLMSKIRCNKCKVKSKRCERMMDLTVEIHGDIATLDEALHHFTSPEILDGENKYECNRCKSYEQARKRLVILEAPNILTIVLKRFQSGKFEKLNKSVQFPEYLNLALYMSGDDASPVYQLYAVIVHKDVRNSIFSGHYVCYVKDTQSKWYKIDDSKVKLVELKKVLSKGPYILLYARCLPRAPRSVRRAMANDIVQARKTKSKEAKGKLGGYDMEDLLQQQVERENDNFPPSYSVDKGFQPPTDSSNDGSSLFDESSSCSIESKS
ncbi:ubiquitin carboxyl-terminal hydrolase 17-like [Zingiber officinale]|uniref:ubiquitin carboxyl-terminal hydrolase 17-like n=1 Tax=Zingiber officinale TaxID=94328 RepID=UPI001C4DC7AA|nr:ubiquitin carboxyl-terminal hydrolase 17-like [Zingiber officinale]